MEMLDDIAGDLMMINRNSLLGQIAKSDIKVMTGTKCKEIVDNDVICIDKNGTEIKLPFNIGITATGPRPETKLVKKIEETFTEVYVIGDCIKIGKIGDAVHKGYMTRNRI